MAVIFRWMDPSYGVNNNLYVSAQEPVHLFPDLAPLGGFHVTVEVMEFLKRLSLPLDSIIHEAAASS